MFQFAQLKLKDQSEVQNRNILAYNLEDGSI